MDLARYVVDAVVLEGRSYREVARAHGVSKSWVGKLVTRYRHGGYEAIRVVDRSPAAADPLWLVMAQRVSDPG